MKSLTSALIAASLVACVPAAGLAQTTDRGKPSSGTMERGTTQRSTDRDAAKRERATWSNTQGLHEAKDIVGTKVQNAQGKDIGKVDALLVDPKDGKVSHAVIGLGGFLGLGEDKVVVPYSALKMSGHDGSRKAAITIDQSAVESAPKYVKASDRSPSASPSMRGTDGRSTTTDQKTNTTR